MNKKVVGNSMKNFGSRNFLEKFVVDELKTENDFSPPTIHYNRFSTPLRGVRFLVCYLGGLKATRS